MQIKYFVKYSFGKEYLAESHVFILSINISLFVTQNGI